MTTMAMKGLMDAVVDEKHISLTIYSLPETFTGLLDHYYSHHERPGKDYFTIYTIGLHICQ